MSIRDPLVLLTVYKYLHSILDKISFLRAFPSLKAKGYVKQIDEISQLPTKAFGYRLECMVRNVECDPNIKLNRFLWRKSSANKYRKFVETPRYDIYEMDDVEKHCNMYTTSKGSLRLRIRLRIKN